MSSRKSSSPNNSSDFFIQLSQEKEEKPQPVRKSTRIAIGVIIGMLLGVVYGLVTQLTNSIFSPGVPFALYPFGLIGNMIVSIAVWAVIGCLCAWPNSAISGALLGSLSAGTMMIILALVSAPPVAPAAIVQFFSTSTNLFAFVLFALLTIPLLLLIRWAIEVQGELTHLPIWSWRRLRAPLAPCLLLGIVMSVLTLYDENVRQAMVDMNELIQTGLSASDITQIPDPLRSNQVNDFLLYAVPEYTLEHSYYDQYQRDLKAADNAGTVIVARFQNGWILACQFYLRHVTPHCKSYDLPKEAFDLIQKSRNGQ